MITAAIITPREYRTNHTRDTTYRWLAVGLDVVATEVVPGHPHVEWIRRACLVEVLELPGGRRRGARREVRRPGGMVAAAVRTEDGQRRRSLPATSNHCSC